jgi:hypothetical protein
VADQGSTDGTLQELQKTPGIQVLINDSPTYDEAHRQKLLLACARKITGKRILLGLDADEALSANSIDSQEWQLIENASPGTILRFKWINILPGFKTAWIPNKPIACGFVDDGIEHVGTRIHSPRVPRPENAPVLDLKEIGVLHFQYAIWERMESKQRWYQAWEHCKNQKKGPLEIYRQYNHMYGGWAKDEIVDVDPSWFRNYEQNGIDFKKLKAEEQTWWDREVMAMIQERGADFFERIAIWDKDWKALSTGKAEDNRLYSDPRRITTKIAHKMLRETQATRETLKARILEKILRLSGW